ncbi:MAG: hypothetical protein PHU34_11755 [Candidatus Methanoperedens sp.]|nr:hypothetical protein [Candidatus Methanoperedens sp.]
MTEIQHIEKKTYENAELLEIDVGTKKFEIPQINKNNGKVFHFWTNVEIVFDYVWSYLLEKFSDDILLPEVDRIDIMNLTKNIPIEIQSTIVNFSAARSRVFIQHNLFFSHVKNQLYMNITKYGKCWFFFDWEYFDYIIDGIGKDSIFSLYELFGIYDPDSLKVFVVRYNGEIKELTPNHDMPILNKDEEMLEKNRTKILNDVLKKYGFTSSEIKKYRDTYFKEVHESDRFWTWLLTKRDDNRAILLSHIIQIQKRLREINMLLDRQKKPFANWFTYTTFAARTMGIIFLDQTTKKYGFLDQFSMCKYFPAYQRNEAFWNSLNGKKLNRKQFNEIVFKKGATKLEDYTS